MRISDSLKAKSVIGIAGILVLCLAAVSCGSAGPAGAPGLQGAPGPSVTAGIVLEANQVDMNVRGPFMAAGSGFTPNSRVDVYLVGAWKATGTDTVIVDPKLWVAMTNEWGAFNENINSRDKFIQSLDIEPGTVCVVKAVERGGEVSVTAPLEIVKSE